MNHWSFVFRSLTYHWRLNLAVALGVAAGTAVLTGALLIGNSVRGSLRDLTLQRLGPVEESLVSPTFFRQHLADELAGEKDFAKHFSAALPAIVLQVSLENPANQQRAGRVHLYGVDDRFFNAFGAKSSAPGGRQIVVNQQVGKLLGAEEGARLLLRIPEVSDIPREIALGNRDETVRSQGLTLARVIPDDGVGRFGLEPNQQQPRNAFVPLSLLQGALGEDGDDDHPARVNALLVTGKSAAPQPDSHAALTGWLRPKLDDYGLRLEKVDQKDPYYNLTSERLMLPTSVGDAVQAALPPGTAQPVLTYLANQLRGNGHTIPYSTITAMDFVESGPLGGYRDLEGNVIKPLGADEIALVDWAADDLQVKVGDKIEVSYFEPETTHSDLQESTATLTLAAVIKLDGAAADRHLTPNLPGVTGTDDIRNWKPPFPDKYFHRDWIRDRDETYWDDYGPTPKAYVSLATGHKLWGSRFGNLTGIRIKPFQNVQGDEGPVEVTPEEISARIEKQLKPARLGLVFRDVKAQGLAASSGTTPFDALFLGFSFFIIAAAVMLVSLLFRLGVDGRAAQVGTLLAEGINQKQLKRILSHEGLLVAVAGGVLGTALGVGYARLMLAALTDPNWWLAAISSPFLTLHVDAVSLVGGCLLGIVVSYVAIRASVRRLGQQPVRGLLAGQTSDEFAPLSGPRWSRWVAPGSLVLGIILVIAAFQMEGEEQAGCFFGSGAMLLTALLSALLARLKRPVSERVALAGSGALRRLAQRNAARNPTRSVLTVGLVASATFLIVAISAFHIDTSLLAPNLDSGNGGFALVAETDRPVFENINDVARPDSNWNFTPEERETLKGIKAYGLRVRSGNDASCLNLYQTAASTDEGLQVHTRVLGLPDDLIDRGGFAWGGSLAETESEQKNPWLLLRRKTEPKQDQPAPVPVVLDAATAQYSLHVGVGDDRLWMRNDAGQAVHLQVVGVLKNSLLQGDVLMSEANFRRNFPSQAGYQFFLIDAPEAKAGKIASVLESSQKLGDLGIGMQLANDRLAGFLRVQNTYLSTFQSLGGLGLLLGTFGLATVQLRNVLERRGELALMRAAGLRRTLLARLVLTENVALLVGGLALGTVSALVAILPHLISGSSEAAVPWTTLAALLGIILVVGLLASQSAVRTVLTMPLLPALKEE